MDRTLAETDERFRQVIPYVVLREHNRLFSYVRTRRGQEQRLHQMRSIGVGGHINPTDFTTSIVPHQEDPIAALMVAARREIAEEIMGFGPSELKWLGFICSNATDVERVHFGIVYVADVQAESIELSQEGRMSDAMFVDIDDLRQSKSNYEKWSAIVIDYLANDSRTL